MNIAIDHRDERRDAGGRRSGCVPIAEGAGLTMAEMALAWVLRRTELASAIIGASRPEQVQANAAASGIELSADVLEAIDDALGDAPVTGQTLAVLATAGVRHRA